MLPAVWSTTGCCSDKNPQLQEWLWALIGAMITGIFTMKMWQLWLFCSFLKKASKPFHSGKFEFNSGLLHYFSQLAVRKEFCHRRFSKISFTDGIVVWGPMHCSAGIRQLWLNYLRAIFGLFLPCSKAHAFPCCTCFSDKTYSLPVMSSTWASSET